MIDDEYLKLLFLRAFCDEKSNYLLQFNFALHHIMSASSMVLDMVVCVEVAWRSVR